MYQMKQSIHDSVVLLVRFEQKLLKNNLHTAIFHRLAKLNFDMLFLNFSLLYQDDKNPSYSCNEVRMKKNIKYFICTLIDWIYGKLIYGINV